MLPKLKRFIAKKIVLGDRNLKNQEKKKLTGKTKGKKKLHMYNLLKNEMKVEIKKIFKRETKK